MELTLSGSLCPVVMLLAFPNKTLTTSLTWLLKVLCSRGDCPGQTFAVASHSILLVGLDVTFKRSQRKASYFLQNASRDSRASCGSTDCMLPLYVFIKSCLLHEDARLAIAS